MEQPKVLNFWGRGYYIESSRGYYPRFTLTLKKRIKKKKASNISVNGEAGDGKSYVANNLARMLSKYFTVQQVVFTYREFLEAVLFTRMGVPIVFDEPSYAMSKREWYKELNQALVKTIESFRFKVHPLFIPIINKSLLDKTIRNYLLQFQVVVRDRGKADVYRLFPSQFQDQNYQYFFCKLRYPIFDRHLCNKESCLGCHYMLNEDDPCNIFRAQYERKKAWHQDQRYDQQYQEAQTKEISGKSLDQIMELLMPQIDKCLNSKGKIDISKMKAVLRRELKAPIGHNKAYDLRALIEYDFPEYA